MEEFWKGKRVLLTGDTGFKGAWMSLWLQQMGAKVSGFSLPPEPDQPSIFSFVYGQANWSTTFGNVQNPKEIAAVVRTSQPEIVIHMAGQAIVGRSYQDPLDTYATNLMGTVNLLWALQNHASPRAVLIITSDKVYENHDTGLAFNEDDRLGGDDPYSASKACAELAVNSWRASYFDKLGIPLATARGSNVIGGGDWSYDRLIPNYIRSIDVKHSAFIMRNPDSIRAWQHALDTVNGYLTYVMKLYNGEQLPLSLNFGPLTDHNLTAGEVVNLLQEYMAYPTVVNTNKYEKPYPEKNTLLIDASKAQRTLGWEPILSAEKAIFWTAQWYKAYLDQADMYELSIKQIKQYEEMKHEQEQLSVLQNNTEAESGRFRKHAVG
jgi:CDP-glucose 4,6-dehydratase